MSKLNVLCVSFHSPKPSWVSVKHCSSIFPMTVSKYGKHLSLHLRQNHVRENSSSCLSETSPGQKRRPAQRPRSSPNLDQRGVDSQVLQWKEFPKVPRSPWKRTWQRHWISDSDKRWKPRLLWFGCSWKVWSCNLLTYGASGLHRIVVRLKWDNHEKILAWHLAFNRPSVNVCCCWVQCYWLWDVMRGDDVRTLEQKVMEDVFIEQVLSVAGLLHLHKPNGTTVCRARPRHD